MDEFNQFKETMLPMLIDYGTNIVWAIVILIIGWGVAKWFAHRVEKYIQKSERVSQTLDPLLVKGVKFLVLGITFLAVLNRFGVETTSVIALLGAIGLAIGLALQGTLSNVASGVMLFVLRPFEVGDIVEIKGRRSVVDEVGLFVTTVHSFDNVELIITNTEVWSDVIENHSRHATQRVDLVIGIHYNDSIDEAMDIIREILENDERVLAEPEPLIAVGALADNSVNLYVRPWSDSGDQWLLELDLRKRIKERFDEAGITIPFPQRDLHLFRENISGQ